MRRAVPFLLLPLVLALALGLREAAAPGHRRPAGAAPAHAPAWLVDDPDAAYHLRRVQLALASGEVPRFDRFIHHPAGSPIPWPPFMDGLLAGVGGVLADGDPGDPADAALGGHDEAELEAALVHVPPVLGALAALAVFAATLALCGGGAAGPWCALLAALVYACSPASVWYGEVTRIDHHVLVALLLAVNLVLLTWALRSAELVDAMTGALLAGVVSGAALLAWLASGVLVAVFGVALFVAAFDADAARARNAARAGILFFVAAAVTTLVPASRSAWNAVEPHSLVNLTEAVPRALGCAALPFVAAGLLARPGRHRGLVLAAALVSLAAVPFLAPGFAVGVAEGLDWATRENAFMAVVGESQPLGGLGEAARWLSPAVLVFPLAWIALLPGARRPETLLLLLLGAVLLAMTCVQRRFGNSFAVPLACTLGVALARLPRDRGRGVGEDGTRPAPRWRRVAAGSGAAVVAGSALLAAGWVLRVPRAEHAELARYRAEVIGGLRWMRSETPSPGPWNAPGAPQDYGVLAHWGLGHLVEYHARRPSVATNFGSFVGERGFRGAAEALLETRPDALHARMHALGARYLVVRARDFGDVRSTARTAGVDPARLYVRTAGGRKVFGPRVTESALHRLALHDEETGSRHYPGLRLVYRSRRMETPWPDRPPSPGDPAGPVISVYLLEAEGPDAAEAVMEAGS